MRVLVSDPLSQQGVDILQAKAQVDVNTGLSKEQLLGIIKDYDAIVVRSGTQVDADVIDAGKKLKVVGRAGVGVDNIDVNHATEKGIVVINAPSGNTISAAEHTVAMMTSLARNIPQANTSLKKGQWKRSKFVGVELDKKVLGVIGLGRVGSEVVKRAKAMGMEIIAYDPYISEERAKQLGVILLPLDDIYPEADFLTIHIPKTAETEHLIGAREIRLMKPGIRIINCARGGLIDDTALAEALQSGHVAGAAIDVWEQEPPAEDNPLIPLDNVIVTPHLGASTKDAQIGVAVEVADQVLLALDGQQVLNAVNVAAVPPETMAEVEPFIPLMRNMGSFYQQYFNGKISDISITYSGEIAEQKVTPLTTSFLMGLFSTMLTEHINYVNAPIITKQRGVKVKEILSQNQENFTSLISVNVTADNGENKIAGTVFNRKEMRIVQIGNYRVDVTPAPYMLVAKYIDKPGVIGRAATVLGSYEINIAGMQVGRASIGGEAVMVLQVDNLIPKETIAELDRLDSVISTKFVQFKNV